MKKIMKVVLLTFLLLSVLVIGWWLWGQYGPLVKSDYYKTTMTGGQKEAIYTAPGNDSVQSIKLDPLKNSLWQHKVWYPTELMTTDKIYPIIVITNGSNMTFSRYIPIFEHLASWGFVVVGNNDRQSWTGASAVESLNFLIYLNADKSSFFYHKLDLKNIGIYGGSQGGVGAINAVTNFDHSSLFTSLFTASATSLELAKKLKWSYDVSKIRIPSFMISSTGKYDSELITPLVSLKENVSKMQRNLKIITARRKNIDHDKMMIDTDGYMTAWFSWTLKNDKKAEGIFTGSLAELKNNPNWQDVQIQNE
ncbi:poly(ethylene terephthalate) hydrolase family protein [Paenibacillus sp. PsM32]|uniref:poly(ethylene terephthalate) hydrolase family protein n=1 Tax=Paenibacillus sp. PsM32 TaxID=3030536 RepID=UPI003F884D73